jgi:hypothetical protein
MMRKEMKVRLVCVTAMLQHNSRLANPMDPAAKLLKAETDKGGKKKTDANYEAIAKAEFFGGIIMDDHGNFIIPESQIEAMIRDAGWNEVKISKAESVGSISVDAPFILVEFEGPKDPKQRYGDKNCMDQRLVTVSSKKVVRTRPMFKGWVAEGAISYDSPYTEEKLQSILEVCGDKGIGDYRPKFGRFNVEFL